MTTEKIFINLLTLISGTMLLDANGNPTSTPAFVTTGRRLPQVSNVSQVQQPACYIIEGEQDLLEKAIALAKYEIHCAAVILCRNEGGAQSIASTQLNALRDAFIFQLQQRGLNPDGTTISSLPGGLRQTLGGVVYHARVKGRMLMNEGLQNNQAAIVMPISILSPM